MKQEILKKVFVNDDGHKILTVTDLHKKVNAVKHIQEKASTEWIVEHNLNTTGIVAQIFDENGIVIVPENVAIDNSFSVTITFTQEQTGKALVIGNSLP